MHVPPTRASCPGNKIHSKSWFIQGIGGLVPYSPLSLCFGGISCNFSIQICFAGPRAKPALTRGCCLLGSSCDYRIKFQFTPLSSSRQSHNEDLVTNVVASARTALASLRRLPAVANDRLHKQRHMTPYQLRPVRLVAPQQSKCSRFHVHCAQPTALQSEIEDRARSLINPVQYRIPSAENSCAGVTHFSAPYDRNLLSSVD